ncbi:conserved oligomeric Golgi complex subunit 6 [Selaginella moellendorffii]|uniref:conserved oligomeric Golgi complex subunit 6 n=1 Tax=Selaginella moellendorffii TaxID=88036 RepID=UPI000D1C6B3E|nr:conserved oligomeric Golgi complex subunit 6 [Selaginella moellendorffii]|eukprot:XP_024518707.1 conserved oligomeric Golgi complex subunit 6 [Selaginella moellendorffii]
MAAATALAPGLARKLKKVLETRTDSPDVLASLGTLSTFYAENSAQARRNLQATIEKRGLSINEEFLRASEAAQKALDAVELEVAGLAESCERIAKSLSSCEAVTGDIVATTEKLRLDLDNTKQHQEIVASFLHNYQLSPEEVYALREEELNQNFFKALSRVQKIHANCKLLVRTHHQRAGLELMDMMAVYQEGAFERLCRWVQAECRNLSDNDHPEVSELLKTASRFLNERPVLFKYCAEEVANTRHNALFRRFISALTRGGPGGMPRPIEVHAHDPLRYVGDMLGWLHQALASERELAMSLFCPDAPASTGDWSSKESDESASHLLFVLDRIFEGVCRPFKVRVEQVLQSQPSLILSYKLCNLLGFYSHMISDLLGKEAALSATLRDVKEAADRTFFDILKSRGDKLLRYPPPVSADLSPPPALAEVVPVLVDLIDTHNSMMVAVGASKPDFKPVIAALVDPIITMCERAAASYASKPSHQPVKRLNSLNLDTGKALLNAARRTTSTDPAGVSPSKSQTEEDVPSLRKIFLINCVSVIRQPLLSYPAASGYVESLESSLEEYMSYIVEHEVATILEKCNLRSKVAYLKANPEMGDGGATANEQEMAPSNVAESLKIFLRLVGEGAVAEFGQVQDARLRNEACVRVAKELASAYKLIYDASPEYRSILRHSPEQMQTMLLGI